MPKKLEFRPINDGDVQWTEHRSTKAEIVDELIDYLKDAAESISRLADEDGVGLDADGVRSVLDQYLSDASIDVRIRKNGVLGFAIHIPNLDHRYLFGDLKEVIAEFLRDPYDEEADDQAKNKDVIDVLSKLHKWLGAELNKRKVPS